MAEEKLTNGQGTEAKPNDVPAEAKPKEQDDTVTIRKGEYSGLKTQLKQMQKQLEEYSSARAAEDAAKLKAAADWETLEKKKNAELEAMKSEMATVRRSALSAQAKAALLGAGIHAGLTADGALSTLPTDIEAEGIAAWVETIKAAHPEAFGAPAVPIGAPSVGSTGKPTADTAASLKAEWEATRRKGPDAMMAVKRKVDAYMSQTGKNPLA